jgi:tRNA 2-thiouridine synthesizing protein D
MMSVALLVNTSPYGTEGPFNALRFTQALELAGERVELLFMGDAVNTARRGQDPRSAHASLEALLTELVEKGVNVTLCGTCCQARGLQEDDLVGGAVVGTIHDFARIVKESDKTVSF